MAETNDDLILFDNESGKITDDLINFYNEEPVKKVLDNNLTENEEDDDILTPEPVNTVVKKTPNKPDPVVNTNEDDDNEDNDDENVKEHKERFEHLQEIGALYLPEDYEIPDSEEKWEKALKDSQEYRKKDAIQSIWEELPEEGRPLLEYLLAGGKDINKFKEVYNSEFDITKVDITNEEDKKKVLETYYKKKGFTPEKARKQVEIVDNLMELDTESRDAYEELKQLDVEEKKKLLESAALAKAQREEAETKKWNILQTTLEKTDDFGGGYVIGKKAKPKALESLYKQVKLEDGSTTTDFNYRLRHVVLQDPKLTLVLADFLNKLKTDDKTKELYFDLSNIKSSVETKMTRTLQDKLDTLASTSNKFKNGSAQAEKDRTKTNFWDKVL